MIAQIPNWVQYGAIGLAGMMLVALIVIVKIVTESNSKNTDTISAAIRYSADTQSTALREMKDEFRRHNDRDERDRGR